MEKGNANRLNREIIALKRDNQNLRQQIIELQWQMQQQKLKILTATCAAYVEQNEQSQQAN
jgi:hypothetical protein